MPDLLIPLAIAAFLWWGSTGAILWLVRRSDYTYPWTATGATVLLALATGLAIILRQDTSPMAAYLGFGAGLAMWAWHEIMFLFGFISGPNKSPCPQGLSLGQRFKLSASTVIHHEIAIAVNAALVAVLCWNAANKMAAMTFFLLWGMRLSVKLLIFAGAPRVNGALLPAHLAYLDSHFSRAKSSGPAFLGLAGAAIVTFLLGLQAMNAPFAGFEWTGWMLLTALAGLATIEHLALFIPFPDEAIWAWALGSSNKNSTPTNNEKSAAEYSFSQRRLVPGDAK